MRTISLLAPVAVAAFLTACSSDTTSTPISEPTHTGDDGTGNPSTGNPTSSTEDSNGEHQGGNPIAGEKTAPTGGTTVNSDTWTGTKDLAASVVIPAGQTITIDPGTVVTAGAGVSITVQGTLKVAASDNHAKISGASWQGIIVASGGTLDADGLEVSGAAAALWTQAGNASASFKDGVIDGQTPFKMEAGSKLTVDHTNVTATSGSAIAGTFVATFMTYDKTTAGGLTLNDAAGTMSITDSTLKGAGGGDFVISDKGTKVTVAYTTITGAHCGFHFSSVGSFSIDHVSSEGNSYGAMLYGSTMGGTITASNWRANDMKDLDPEGTNGPITMTGSFVKTVPAGITASNPAAVAVPDAQPRTN